MVKKKETDENGEGVEDFAAKVTVWTEESGEDEIGKDEVEDELGENTVGQEGEIIKLLFSLCRNKPE